MPRAQTSRNVNPTARTTDTARVGRNRSVPDRGGSEGVGTERNKTGVNTVKAWFRKERGKELITVVGALRAFRGESRDRFCSHPPNLNKYINVRLFYDNHYESLVGRLKGFRDEVSAAVQKIMQSFHTLEMDKRNLIAKRNEKIKNGTITERERQFYETMIERDEFEQKFLDDMIGQDAVNDWFRGKQVKRYFVIPAKKRKEPIEDYIERLTVWYLAKQQQYGNEYEFPDVSDFLIRELMDLKRERKRFFVIKKEGAGDDVFSMFGTMMNERIELARTKMSHIRKSVEYLIEHGVVDAMEIDGERYIDVEKMSGVRLPGTDTRQVSRVLRDIFG